MSFQSFFVGFALLALVFVAFCLLLNHVEERRGWALGSMVEMFGGLFVGITYSVVALCISTDWAYSLRVLAGLVLGIVVGFALVVTASLSIFLISAVVEAREARREHNETLGSREPGVR